MKRYLAMILAVLMLLLCGACGTKNENTSGSEPAAATPAAETETPASDLYAPLTGEPQSEDTSAARPYAVMINNIIYAQPQVGVSKADWIYEVPAEGGITRMMAIFSDLPDVESVGSIRSLRPYYLSIALSYDAIVIHGGGSEQAYSDLTTYHADHLDGVRDDRAVSGMFYRDPSRGAHGSEHTLFFYGEKVAPLAEEYGFRLEHQADYTTGLSFSDDASAQGTGDADSVTVTFNTSKTTKFTYHADTGKYTAAQYGSDYIDGATGEVVGFSNVLVLSASMRAVDDYGRLAVELTGSGTGYLATGGTYVPIKWSRSSVNDCFTYTLEDGTPLELARGTTFAAIIPTDGGSVDFS